ncbi:hypothetical protein ABIA95_003065 [Bradyrhizobium sp. LA8.1]
MSEQEQPVHGGSYTRQLDGSLLRNEEKPAAKDAKTPAAPKKQKEV